MTLYGVYDLTPSYWDCSVRVDDLQIDIKKAMDNINRKQFLSIEWWCDQIQMPAREIVFKIWISYFNIIDDLNII